MRTRSEPHPPPALPARAPGATRLPFDIAGGRTTGADHRRADRPCQDAFTWTRTPHAIIATVSDGCGSGRHSEVGATLGARLWTAAVADLLDHATTPADATWTWDHLWTLARRRVCATLAQLATTMGGPAEQTVTDHFLFTIVCAAITPTTTAICAIGDGAVAIDQHITTLGPFPDNQPPYLAYDLLCPDKPPRVQPHDHRRVLPTADLQSIILATDGADDLDPHGTSGGLTQFCHPRYFRNRDALRRRLAVINRETCDLDRERGRVLRSRGALGDDTAVIAIRRTGAPS